MMADVKNWEEELVGGIDLCVQLFKEGRDEEIPKIIDRMRHRQIKMEIPYFDSLNGNERHEAAVRIMCYYYISAMLDAAVLGKLNGKTWAEFGAHARGSYYCSGDESLLDKIMEVENVIMGNNKLAS